MFSVVAEVPVPDPRPPGPEPQPPVPDPVPPHPAPDPIPRCTRASDRNLRRSPAATTGRCGG